ncbi:helix-turn-helix domain-containing protein [Clostridium sp.]|uniref:helix-turn-helix domain-containing protein n=1 Tax=Clostridium sp. TaxID=1506 RepID=UPI0028521BB2|nr:helix-turn-helix domain-containing protein [Clostridium sp.]MDR3598750.1 helix-turn-helix domain-containing protein [Clostridium sp.]
MRFLTQGEKIRTLRATLNMKQQDLASENITRPFISMIEVGKRNLTYDTANSIIEKFNNKAIELEINLDIDIHYLLRSQSEDASIYCLEKLKNNNIDEIFNEVIKISTEFNLLEVKSATYKAMGDSYFDKKNFVESFINYINAIDIYKDINENKDISYLYWKSALCKAYLLQYKEALSYFSLSRHYSLLYNDTKTKDISLYHIAKCHMKLNNINLARIHINNYLSICNKDENFNYYVNANILKANCYEIEKKFNDAIDIYKSLIEDLIDSQISSLGIIYNNLGLAYSHKNNFKASIKYFEMAIKFRTEYDEANLSHTLIEKSIVLLHQELYFDAIETLKLGLKYAEAYNDLEYLVKGNYLIARIYNILNDNDNLEKTYLKIADLLKDTDSNDLILIYNDLASMYLNKNNIVEANHYLFLSKEVINKSPNLLYHKNI